MMAGSPACIDVVLLPPTACNLPDSSSTNVADRTRTPLRRLAAIVQYLAYLLAASLAVIYVFAYRPYVGELAQGHGHVLDRGPPRHVSADTVRQLGNVSSDSSVRFLQRRPTATAGTVRLCALGDSHTAGDEVGADADYPSYLQREFDDLGVDNVEVINFGNAWHGFSQVTVMWEEVASRFDCSIVVLLPYEFWWTRDTSFNHAAASAPYYLHARHILSADGVERLDVSGTTDRIRFDRYHAFLPRWRYLRYDYQSPALIRAMLPADRKLPNPFYHVDDPEAEARELHRRLLARIASYGVPVVVLFERDHGLIDTLTTNAPDNVGFAKTRYRWSDFPYAAPIWHRSPWGNQVTARTVLRAVLEEPPSPLQRFQFETAETLAQWDPPPPLDDAERVTLSLADEEVGVVVSVHDRNQGVDQEGRHPAVLSASGVRGLLAIVRPDEHLLDACLLPLGKLLSPGDEVVIRSQGGDAVSLGRPGLVSAGAAIWLLERPGSWCTGTGALHLPARDMPSGRGLTLVAGDNRLPLDRDGQWLRAGAGSEPLFKFATLGADPADVGSMQPAGEVFLVLESAARRRAVPIARWRLTAPRDDVEVLTPSPVAIRIDSGRATVGPRP